MADALNRVTLPPNRWVQTHGARNRETAGMATTLSILVLRGKRYTIAHVGDCRIYRLNSNGLRQLTTDHVWDLPNMRHVLKRAIGLDSQLQVDYAEGELQILVLPTPAIAIRHGRASASRGIVNPAGAPRAGSPKRTG